MRDDPRYAELRERAFGWPLDEEMRWPDGVASERRLHAVSAGALEAALEGHGLAMRSWDEARGGPRCALVVAQRRRR